MTGIERPRSGERQTCLRCAHYYITYDPSFPYGCRALGFKSRRMPQLEVVEASQTACQAFQAKKKLAAE